MMVSRRHLKLSPKFQRGGKSKVISTATAKWVTDCFIYITLLSSGYVTLLVSIPSRSVPSTR